MALQVGDKAPAFTLVASDLSKVSTKDFKGKNIVVLFFPMAFTGVCTKELCSTRDDIARYSKANAQVLGISVDSPFTLAKFKEENGLNFPLLSDFNKVASKKYGAFYTEFVLGLKGVSKRSAFVIDAKGIIKYTEVLDNAGDLPNFEAIQTALSTL
jgi:glutaredoxin-dependent peroxiredoxin